MINKFNDFLNERKTTDFEKEVFNYLNDLRDSGETNMFGAGSYVRDEFNLDKRESQRLVSLWMKNFDEDGNYDEIKD